MKHKTQIRIRATHVFLILFSTFPGLAIAVEPEAKPAGLQTVKEIPSTARFDLKEVKDDRYILVGHLGLRRQFLGTRADPHFQDLVQFHCFDGQELKFSTFADRELESNLVKLLTRGHLLPAILTVRFERKRVGHDGINMSERLIAHIEACEITTLESVDKAAEGAGFETADFERFKTALDPDFSQDGIAISLGKVSVRADGTPRAAAVSIHGIRVFNSTSQAVTIELTAATIEQSGVSQLCAINARSRAPGKWQIEAGEWADGLYESGAMPGTLWMFDPAGAIKPDKEVKVQINLKVNGNQSVTLTRTVNPL